MQHVLVHIDQNLGPIGAWSYSSTGVLTHFYPESLDTAISGRARLLMAQRDDDIHIPEWMDLLADSDPNVMDEFQTLIVNDGISLAQILTDFRRSWTATD